MGIREITPMSHSQTPGKSDDNNPQSQDTVNCIVQKAMREHQRRKSQFQAIQDDLGLVFDDDDVRKISRDVMKNIFAKKQNKQLYWQQEQLNKGYEDHLKNETERLKNEIMEKNKEVQSLKQQIVDLTASKIQLAQNTNKILNQMRGYLLEYQQATNNLL